MTTEDLLGHARSVLIGEHKVPHAPRAAAVLARQALEDVVDGLLTTAGHDMRRASMRSRLISLRVLARPDVAGLAAVTWSGLCRMCHHHAYELAPTVGEVEHLVDRVEVLNSRVNEHEDGGGRGD